jgi:hypothetical protein
MQKGNQHSMVKFPIALPALWPSMQFTCSTKYGGLLMIFRETLAYKNETIQIMDLKNRFCNFKKWEEK